MFDVGEASWSPLWQTARKGKGRPRDAHEHADGKAPVHPEERTTASGTHEIVLASQEMWARPVRYAFAAVFVFVGAGECRRGRKWDNTAYTV